MFPMQSPPFAALATLLLLLPARAQAEAGASAEAFRAIVERPLFRPDRRPVGAAKVAEEELPPLISDDFGRGLQLRLVGTVVEQGRAVALVELGGEVELVRLAAGDRVGEWRVVEVEADSLLLSDGRVRRRFTLLER